MRNKRKLLLAIASAAAVCALGSIYSLSLANPSAAPVNQPAAIQVALSGKVSQLLVKDGDTVTSGQVLAKLDTATYEKEIAEAEAEITQLQNQAASSISPMQAVAGISGFLPSQVPQPEYVTVPVKQPSGKTVAPVQPPAQPSPKPVDGYKVATVSHEKAQADHQKAIKALTEATAALAEAQDARDALRPKITLAEAEAVQAEKKAVDAPTLLAAGVISAKRSQELEEVKAATAKALDDMKAQVIAAERALGEAKSAQEVANANLDKATQALTSAGEQLAKSNVETPQAKQPQPEATKTVPAKPIKTETKIIMRRMPMVVREEEAPALPVQVFVDEKAMKSTSQRILELTKKIEDLKKQIAASEVVAPTSGIVRISASGSITIEPVASLTRR